MSDRLIASTESEKKEFSIFSPFFRVPRVRLRASHMRGGPGRRAEGTRFFRDGGGWAPRSVWAPPALASGSVQTRVEAREYTRADLPRAGKQFEHGRTSRVGKILALTFRCRARGPRRRQKSPVREGFPRRARFGRTSEDGWIVQNQRHAASTKSEHMLRWRLLRSWSALRLSARTPCRSLRYDGRGPPE